MTAKLSTVTLRPGHVILDHHGRGIHDVSKRLSELGLVVTSAVRVNFKNGGDQIERLLKEGHGLTVCYLNKLLMVVDYEDDQVQMMASYDNERIYIYTVTDPPRISHDAQDHETPEGYAACHECNPRKVDREG